jgi:hypothetical protein
MNRIPLLLAGVALVLAGAIAGWLVSSGTSNVRDADHLAADVARLRSVVESQADRIARLEAARADPRGTSRGRRSPGTPGPPGVPKRPGVEPAPPGTVERGREVLAELKELSDGSRVVAIREALRQLVLIGDAAVPDIVALLDSGYDRNYVDGKMRLQHIEGYAGLRMVLFDALKEIGTPVAKTALLAAVKRSGRIRDYRDLLVPHYSTADPALVAGISALVPDMLRKLGEVGIRSDDSEVQDLAGHLPYWIRKRGVTGVLDPVQKLLLGMPSRAKVDVSGYANFLGILVQLAPERAAEVVLRLRETHTKRTVTVLLSSSRGHAAPRALLVRYYGKLLSRSDLEPHERQRLYSNMPWGGLKSIEDPAERAEDLRTLVAFLEERLEVEVEENVKSTIRSRLDRFRRDLESSDR